MVRVCGFFVLCLGWLSAGCVAPPEPVRLSSPNPAIKARAAKRAAKAPDQHSLRQLVKDLDSDDAAVRFYAIGALRRTAGDSFGYEYYADEERRRPAVRRWQQWLEAREVAPTTGQAVPELPPATGREDGTACSKPSTAAGAGSN